MSDCTFIIPIKIDSSDRKRNCKIVLNYLLDNLDFDITILEIGTSEVHECVDLNNSRISYDNVCMTPSTPFHRTKYLNTMAKKCKTEIVCSYDIDVILPIRSYLDAVNHILSDNYDVIYPYGDGFFQRKVSIPENINRIKNPEHLNEFNIENGRSYCGHCNFQKKSVYEKSGYENEEFISYAPEDQEKLYRYTRMGFRVGRIDDVVYHLEHERGVDSEITNPFYNQNMLIFENIKNMNDIEFNQYCEKLRHQ
jgi:hypothetical protein